MRKKLFLGAAIMALALSAVLASSATATSSYEGQIVKMEGLDTLYYVASDGKRYVFPNFKTYQTWFTDFSDVVTLTAEEIMALPLGGNVRYRPGVVLIKITTDPKVYAVTQNGRLRWVKTEQLARKLYGENWNLLVDDVPDSFFTNYTVAEDINEESDYDADEETAATETVDGNRGLQLGHAKRANTVKCRAIPATPGHHGTSATPATPARECRAEANWGDDEEDTTAPAISAIVVTASTTSATVAWTTDEESNSSIEYALESLSTASSSDIMSIEDSSLVTSHELTLDSLIASTTYYYIVKSTDASDNTSASDEDAFTTLAE